MTPEQQMVVGMTRRKRRSDNDRLRLFLLHGGRCHFCGHKIDGVKERWELSHRIPLALGGDDDDANTMPAHYRCHHRETTKVDQPQIAKAKAQNVRHVGAHRSRSPMPFGRTSKWKRKIGGGVVPRHP